MKGVILGINPRATIVDLCHQVSPQNVAEGALLLAGSYRYFAPDAIFVGVVDPGVGSERQAIALRTPHGTFVGPNNGLFGLVARDFLAITDNETRLSLAETPLDGVILANRSYFLPDLSATFHGRDVFSPVAAHLTLGVPLAALGPPLDDLTLLASLRPAWRNGALFGQVVHIDHFGNAVTNVTATDLARFASPEVTVAGRTIGGLSRYYAERPGLLALMNSASRLEIAISGGSAAVDLGLKPGDTIVVREDFHARSATP